MKYFKIYFFLIVYGMCSLQGAAQTVIKGFEFGEIMNIAETYRQMPSLSFNMIFTYSDSLSQDSTMEQLKASYKIQNGKFWALIDSTEMVQGLTYNLSIYHLDSVITISAPQPAADVMRLPFLDSLFRAQNIDSMNVTKVNDTTKSLRMYFNPASQYTSCIMQYDLSSFLLRSITYVMKTGGPNNSTNNTSTSTLKISFTNYSFALIDDNYFREDKFIYKQDGQYYGQPPYNNFQLVVNATN